MAYEPITGTSPPSPRKFRFLNKRNILVVLLLSAIVAAAVVVIVLATTGQFSTKPTAVSTSVPQVRDGASLLKYDNQSSRLNGGVACEDFAADSGKTKGERNFKVDSATYRDEAGRLVGIVGDDAYDAALANAGYARTLEPLLISYYGQTNEWAEVGATFSCSLMAQKYSAGNDSFVTPAAGNQALADDPVVFPIENVQIVQPSIPSYRLFKDQKAVLGFYDFFFNYFNHGAEIMDLTSIKFSVSTISTDGTLQLGDYSAPSRSMDIYIPQSSLMLLDAQPPVKTSLR